MKNSMEIRRKQPTSYEGYSQELRLETGDNGKVQSMSTALDNGRNDGNACSNDLMEKILTKVNMNKAYKRVVRNKGSYGIDGMSVDELRVRIHPKSIKRIKEKIKAITSRSNAWTMKCRYQKLKQVITGWVSYFRIADMKGIARRLDEWIRRRLRMCYWKRWKKIKTRFRMLKKLGINESKAWEYANTRKGYWRTSNSPILNRAFTKQIFKKLGYFSFTERYAQVINS